MARYAANAKSLEYCQLAKSLRPFSDLVVWFVAVTLKAAEVAIRVVATSRGGPEIF